MILQRAGKHTRPVPPWRTVKIIDSALTKPDKPLNYSAANHPYCAAAGHYNEQEKRYSPVL
ncbi:hypothetical protein BN133_242 [Cronobacter dublinensis 582]|nr:hypothetical protein [Cronobacter dublinensis]CCJ83865.1 hypothetical protein BN133_242 [Cronobacter dublinensis 582]